jgi:hypothetical protein
MNFRKIFTSIALFCAATLISCGSGGSSVSSATDDNRTGEADITASIGGMVKLNNEVVLNIPAKSLGADTTITIERKSNISQNFEDGFQSFGQGYSFTPDGTKFALNKPSVMELSYDETALKAKGLNPKTLVLFYHDKKAGRYVATESRVDIANKKIIANVEHFTVYLPLAKAMLATNNAPDIALQDPVPNPIRAGAPIYLRATIRDNDDDGGVVSPKVYFRKLNPTPDAWQSLPMKGETRPASGTDAFDTYTATVPATYLTSADLGSGDDFEYYVEVYDNLGMYARSSTRAYDVTLTYNAGSITIDPNICTVTAGFYRMFTVSGVDSLGTTFQLVPDSFSVSNSLGTVKNYGAQGLCFAAQKKGIGALTVGAGADSVLVSIIVKIGEITSLKILDTNGLEFSGLLEVDRNATYDFDVLGYDDFGNATPVNPVWSCDGALGVIDQNGHFTAGSTAMIGNVTVTLGDLTATQQVKTLSSAKSILAFSINGIYGTISGPYISVPVSETRDITALVPSFTTNGDRVLVNGSVQTSGSTSQDFTSPLVYTVFAEDGTSRDYTVSITIFKDSNLPAADNCNLLDLRVTPGTLSPVFERNTTRYTVDRAITDSVIAVTPVSEVNGERITINDTLVASGTSLNVPLATGQNTLTVLVTSPNGRTIKTYSITIHRFASSANANLASLDLSAGIYNPSFSPNTTIYSVEVPAAVDTINLTPVAAGKNAMITVNGLMVTSGTESQDIILNPAGALTTITVAVTAENTTTTKSYTLTVARISTSTNADLASLDLSTGTLEPIFNPTQYTYTGAVPASVSVLNVRPVAAGLNATIRVNGATVLSGKSSNPQPVVNGVATFTIEVTAGNGTTHTYTVNVMRKDVLANPSLFALPDPTLSEFPSGGTYPVSVVSDDFNGDGKKDLAVVNTGSNRVSIMLGRGDGTFNAEVNYSVGTNPYSIAKGDFNGDGIIDLAVPNRGSNNISILLGKIDGTFNAAVNYTTGTYPISVTTGDFNQDGKIDIAVANYSSNNISILIGKGDGKFNAAVSYSAGTNPRSITTGDFDRDGKTDLAVANIGNNNVSILFGNGNGTFGTKKNFGVGTGPRSVTTGDFNGDGNPDLAVANYDSANISVLIGNGVGSFNTAVNLPAGTNPLYVTTGDFDRDGKTDLAVANYVSNSVSVFSGNGDGTFNAATNYLPLNGPGCIATGDYNGDGRIDFAVTNYDGNTVSILLGTAGGTFNSMPSYTVGDRSNCIITGDFNGDGKSDLVSASSGSGSHDVFVLLGNGNGTFNTAVPYDLSITGSSPRLVTMGDFNGDGKIDLITINTAFGVSILMGKGDGTFNTVEPYLQVGPYDFLATGDFNGDGKCDLAMPNYFYGNVLVWMGKGDGTFNTSIPYTVGVNPNSVTVGDFNGDGRVDLATANRNSNNVSILLVKGDGTFDDAVNYAVGTAPRFITMGDFNRDGRVDLATINNGSNNVSILLGNGNGTFGSAVDHTVGINPFFITTGDFNGDGNIDIATICGVENVSVLLGKGDGTFNVAINYAIGFVCRTITTGDFNGDGRDDLAVGGDSNNIVILYGKGN